MIHAYLLVGGNRESRKEKLLQLYQLRKPGSVFNNDPDTHILTGETSIKIEEVRNLENALSLKPYNQAPKIAVIVEAKALTFEAQGALLKLLEEPPGETIIFLATDDETSLLPTIVSRCQLIFLPQLPPHDIEKKHLEILSNKILKASEGERLKIVENVLTREQATEFCQTQMIFWREKLRQNPSIETFNILRKIQKTLHYLSANVNPRLALDNLLLSYPQTLPKS